MERHFALRPPYSLATTVALLLVISTAGAVVTGHVVLAAASGIALVLTLAVASRGAVKRTAGVLDGAQKLLVDQPSHDRRSDSVHA